MKRELAVFLPLLILSFTIIQNIFSGAKSLRIRKVVPQLRTPIKEKTVIDFPSAFDLCGALKEQRIVASGRDDTLFYPITLKLNELRLLDQLGKYDTADSVTVIFEVATSAPLCLQPGIGPEGELLSEDTIYKTSYHHMLIRTELTFASPLVLGLPLQSSGCHNSSIVGETYRSHGWIPGVRIRFFIGHPIFSQNITEPFWYQGPQLRWCSGSHIMQDS